VNGWVEKKKGKGGAPLLPTGLRSLADDSLYLSAGGKGKKKKIGSAFYVQVFVWKLPCV